MAVAVDAAYVFRCHGGARFRRHRGKCRQDIPRNTADRQEAPMRVSSPPSLSSPVHDDGSRQRRRFAIEGNERDLHGERKASVTFERTLGFRVELHREGLPAGRSPSCGQIAQPVHAWRAWPLQARRCARTGLPRGGCPRRPGRCRASRAPSCRVDWHEWMDRPQAAMPGGFRFWGVVVPVVVVVGGTGVVVPTGADGDRAGHFGPVDGAVERVGAGLGERASSAPVRAGGAFGGANGDGAVACRLGRAAYPFDAVFHFGGGLRNVTTPPATTRRPAGRPGVLS